MKATSIQIPLHSNSEMKFRKKEWKKSKYYIEVCVTIVEQIMVSLFLSSLLTWRPYVTNDIYITNTNLYVLNEIIFHHIR